MAANPTIWVSIWVLVLSDVSERTIRAHSNIELGNEKSNIKVEVAELTRIPNSRHMLSRKQRKQNKINNFAKNYHFLLQIKSIQIKLWL